MSTVHVYPDGDLIEHDTDTDGCVCGTEFERVTTECGGDGWVVIHHSLDGRELREANSKGDDDA